MTRRGAVAAHQVHTLGAVGSTPTAATMSPSKRDRIAKILVEASVNGDKATAEKFGVSLRSIQRWRSKLPGGNETTGAPPDDKLAQAVAEKKAKVEEGWADEIPEALRDAVKFLRRAAKEADPKDPAAIHSIAGAMKMLSETAATWKVLDARLARQNREIRSQDRPASAGPAGDNRLAVVA